MYEESFSAKAPGKTSLQRNGATHRQGRSARNHCLHPDRLARNSVDGGQLIYLLDNQKLKDLKFATFTFETTRKESLCFPSYSAIPSIT